MFVPLHVAFSSLPWTAAEVLLFPFFLHVTEARGLCCRRDSKLCLGDCTFQLFNCNANRAQPVHVTTGNICVIKGSPHHTAAAGLGKPCLAESNTGYLYKKLKFKWPSTARENHLHLNNITAGFCTRLQPLCPEWAGTGLQLTKKEVSKPGPSLSEHGDLICAYHL